MKPVYFNCNRKPVKSGEWLEAGWNRCKANRPLASRGTPYCDYDCWHYSDSHGHSHHYDSRRAHYHVLVDGVHPCLSIVATILLFFQLHKKSWTPLKPKGLKSFLNALSDQFFHARPFCERTPYGSLRPSEVAIRRYLNYMTRKCKRNGSCYFIDHFYSWLQIKT